MVHFGCFLGKTHFENKIIVSSFQTPFLGFLLTRSGREIFHQGFTHPKRVNSFFRKVFFQKSLFSSKIASVVKAFKFFSQLGFATRWLVELRFSKNTIFAFSLFNSLGEWPGSSEQIATWLRGAARPAARPISALHSSAFYYSTEKVQKLSLALEFRDRPQRHC